MRKFLSVILLLISIYVGIPSVMAIDCAYPDYGLTITYDEKDVKIDYEKFNVNGKYSNFLTLAKWGQGKYTTEEINIDQTLYEKYQGYSCPTDMHVCEYGEWKFNLPSIISAGYELADIFTAIPCVANWMDTDACNKIDENRFTWFTFNKKTLHILTQEEYNKSEIKEYLGGKTSSDISDYKEAWGEWCNTGGWTGELLQSACGSILTLGGVIPAFWETVAKDGLDVVYYKYTNCNVVPYEGPYTPVNVNCQLLNEKIFKIREAIGNYTTCGENGECKAKQITKLKNAEEDTKEYCSYILQNYDYVEGQKGCIDSCLKIRETINSLKVEADLYDDLSGSGNNDCGFSQRLGTWIVNIFKWVKYILPVIVIVLGILDFIKAIGADKEDEMKKAQKRFIVRLIAAALVFIIPLILEFVLIKMGFGYDSCSLF